MSERHVRRPQRPAAYFTLLAAAVLILAGSAAAVGAIASARSGAGAVQSRPA